MLGILGDIHHQFRILFEGLDKSHKDVTTWIQVGDLGDEKKPYPDFPMPFYFISGNHENWAEVDLIDEGKGPKNLIHVKNGDAINLEGLKIVVFGGNFSPKWYPEPRAKLPPSRKKHFVQEDFEKAISHKDVDILITHEAPSPYIIKHGDIGQYVITDIIKAIKPKLHFFGHHHYSGDYEYEGVPSYGLTFGFRDFAKVDPEGLRVKRSPF
jgi:Icc-related predicted phosphoesterase